VDGHVHGEDGGLGAVAGVGVVGLSEASSVVGHEGPLFVALTVVFQADCTCTS